MKQTNKKEFSKFLNKFEKLLDYHVKSLDTGVNLNLFNNKTERFLKTSHCKFVLSVESGRIFLKVLFFDKNENEVFSEELGSSKNFEYLKSKDDNFNIVSSSPIDLSAVGMGNYNFFSDKVNGKNNYKIYKDFVRAAITSFDFLYNNLSSSFYSPKEYTDSYLNAINELLNILIQGNRYSNYNKCYLHILQNLEERNNLFGKSQFFFSGNDELRKTFEFVVKKIETSVVETEKPDKEDIMSLLNIANVFGANNNYEGFTRKLNLICIYIKMLKQTSKFKLEESKHKNVYVFVSDITTNKSNNLIVNTLFDDEMCNNGKRYASELKVSDLKSIFRLVEKK